jgi:3-oxoacyl-[acyl-carrier-protein] synthase-3
VNITTLTGVQIEAIAACLPAQVQDNATACRPLYGDAVDALIKTTGIREKRIASGGISSLDLCCRAAEQILMRKKIERLAVGAVVCVTFTPDQWMPCNAVGAQARLALSRDCLTFDINQACAGYAIGLFQAGLLVRQLNKPVLLLDGDVQSPFVSSGDKGTFPILSDAGTATLLVPAVTEDSWAFAFYSDGSQRDVLAIPAGGSRAPMEAGALQEQVFADGSRRRACDIAMDGFAVFSFVAQTVTKLAAEFIEQTHTALQDVDAFVSHQANVYMVKQLAKKLKIAEEKVLISCDMFGNSASATIPVTLAAKGQACLRKDRAASLLLAGFGAGLSVALARITLPPTCCLDLVEQSET